jgi:hypothetical protein
VHSNRADPYCAQAPSITRGWAAARESRPHETRFDSALEDVETVDRVEQRRQGDERVALLSDVVDDGAIAAHRVAKR